jgi:hypothetical protein
MRLALAVLLLFLLAFAGLALGLLMGRKGVRGGCGSSHGQGDCDTKSRCRCSGHDPGT